MIIETCRAFGVEVTAGDITRGPTITRYEIYPAIGLRVSRITQLEADLARATKAERINILAPIPGKDTVGIEIANDDRVAVALRELLQDESFRSSKRKIPLALGKDVYGNTVVGDLAAMPHCLVAGATGAGKSVCINSIITSILYKFGPDELRFIMIDPKVVEMQVYAKLPHLVVPVVTDPKRVVGALNWCVNEMERRYKIFAKLGVRNFDSFNSRVRNEEEVLTPEEQEDLNSIVDEEAVESMAKAFEDGDLGPTASEDDEVHEDDLEVPDRFPYIVVIIDELADLMQTAPADVEGAIARIAQKARAAGIHLIVATQTPRADVVTGIIKANIPSRIAFQVSSSLDSRVILDNKGAEKLVGKGDMLFLPPGSAKLERAQGAFVSDEEVEQIVNFCANQTEQRFEESIQKVIESGGSDGDGGGEEVSDADEEALERCMEVLRAEGKASTSLLQRRLRLGYTRAARMIDILEARGIVGPADGAKPREVLIPDAGAE
jgi:S-DNA-T family DNA segregation ATPase FtsK/SpoIIIE